ncbi:MAG: glycyl-radical enzyme activating protein [Johnsonella sp.]|nr:glycyl-radical enzyme activating protein [Johnsonella sp.]
MENLILDIQKYSIHNGEGIRTTIFFKGCPLECKWCHNPESKSYRAEIMYNKEKCASCMRCVLNCPQKGIVEKNGFFPVPRDLCDACGCCVEGCFYGAREKAGKQYSVDEIMKEIDKDKMFYEQSNGGVTLSGGEVMAQDAEFVLQILKRCSRMGYSVNIDTCGYASFERFEKILPYVDTFLYDLKHMDGEKHKELTGKDNRLILENLKKLSEKGAKIHIRVPVIEGVNSDDESIARMADFVKNLNITMLSLLPYHEVGKSKYERIDMKYEGENFCAPSAERMEELKHIFERKNIKVKIGG